MRIGAIEKFTLIDFPGTIACVIYTIGCNFRCPYCHNPELVDETVGQELTEEDVFTFLKTRKGKLDGVVITGGEPTMHSDLVSVIGQIKKMGFKVKLDSNGTNPEVLKKVISEELVDCIAMDIKSPLRSYNQTVSAAVDIDSIKKSIDLLINSSIDYEFRTTLIKCLVEPEDVVEIGKEIQGAKRYYLQKFIPTKILNPQFLKKTTYSDSELLDLQTQVQNYVEFCGIR